MRPERLKLPLPKSEAGQCCAECGTALGHASVEHDAYDEAGRPGHVGSFRRRWCPACGAKLKLVDAAELAENPPAEESA